MRFRLCFLILFIAGSFQLGTSQTTIDWGTLSDVRFEVKYDEEIGQGQRQL